MRKIAARVLSAVLAAGFLTVPAAAQDAIDLVVLMDSSKSMFRYYEDVIDYVLSATAKDYLRFGDSFHLLSFADDVHMELAQALKTEQDLKAAIARLYLLYPLGRNTDLVTALEGTYSYVDALPGSASKVIVLISDGVHSPAAGTKYAGLDAPAVSAKVESVASRIKERGWTLKIVRVPFDDVSASGAGGIVTVPGQQATGAAAASGGASSAREGESAPTSPGAGNYLDTVASAGGATVTVFDPSNGKASVDATSGLPSFTLPASASANGSKFSVAATVVNRSGAKLSLELEALLLEDGTDILAKKASIVLEPGASGPMAIRAALPRSLAKERLSVLTLEPRFAGGARVSPARSTLRVERAAWVPGPSFWSPARVVAIVAMAALIVAAAIFLGRFSRRMHRKAEEPIVEAVIDSASSRDRAERGASTASRAAAGAAAATTHARQGTISAGGAEPAVAPGRDAASQDTRRGASASDKYGALESAAARQRRIAAPVAAPAGGRDAGGQTLSGHDAASATSSSKALAMAPKTAHRDAAEQAALLSAAGASQPDDLKAAAVLDAWKAPSASKRALPLKKDVERRSRHASTPISYASKVVRTGSERIVLHVDGQNPNIGKRNIHVMHAGAKKTVGGGVSDFLVFLFPVPRNIAELHYDGDNLALVPLSPDFFPDAEGVIEACVGRPIRIVSETGHELTLRFERYVPPVETINKLLHSIDLPGLPGLEQAEASADGGLGAQA